MHTGDLGSLDERGRLKITGRVKELFKASKGKYVAPAPIENELLLHEAIELVCVTGGDRPQPFAMAILAEHVRTAAAPGRRAATEAALLGHLERVNAELDPHERLDRLIILADTWTIENGMLTPSLKIKRAAIEARYAGHLEAWHQARSRVVWFDP